MICTTILGCGKIERFDIDTILKQQALLAKKSGDTVSLNLCKIEAFKWDRIIIVSPYTPKKVIDNYKLVNGGFVKSTLLDTLGQERHSLLLFVDKDKVSRYGYASNDVIDFNYINDVNTIKTISKQNACKLSIKIAGSLTKLLLLRF